MVGGQREGPGGCANVTSVPRATGWLVLVLAVSLAVRLAFVFVWPGSIGWTDARGYHALALNILQDGSFPTSFRPPGYPVFVAAFYWLFGQTQLPLMLAQALFGTLGVWITYLTGVDVLGRQRRHLALLAAALFGLSPGVAYFSGWLLREGLCTFLVPLAFWLALRMLSRSWVYAWALGVTMAVIGYVRMEIGLAMAVLLVLALLNKGWRWRAVGGGALAGAIALAAMAPWVVARARDYGYASMQSTGDPNFFARTWYLSPTGNVEPELRQRIIDNVRKAGLTEKEQRGWAVAAVMLKELPPGDVRAEVELHRRLGAIARENVRAHPLRFLATMPMELWGIMMGEPFMWWRQCWYPSMGECWRDRHWGVLFMKAFNYIAWPFVMTPLILIGAIGAARRGDPAAWPLACLLLAVLVCLVAMTMINSQGQPHLRVPYDGVLYIAATLGGAFVWQRRRRGTTAQ